MQIHPESWVNNHGDYLYNYAISRLFDKEIAHDLVQDTFLSALHAKADFKGQSTERTWLVSILKHKIIDHFRKKGRKTKIDGIEDVSFEDKSKTPFLADGDMEGSWNMSRVPSEWDENSFSGIEAEEFQSILTHCMGGLPEKWAGIFTLKIIEESSTDEVCKEIGITSSNLWVILHRARLQLRECIEKLWLKD